MLTSKNRLQDECFHVDKHHDHPNDKGCHKAWPLDKHVLSVSGFRVMESKTACAPICIDLGTPSPHSTIRQWSYDPSPNSRI